MPLPAVARSSTIVHHVAFKAHVFALQLPSATSGNLAAATDPAATPKDVHEAPLEVMDQEAPRVEVVDQEASPAPLSASAVKAMKVVELRAALAERSLPTDGLKPVLAARLLEAVTA